MALKGFTVTIAQIAAQSGAAERLEFEVESADEFTPP
jgi:hypothetical protein